MKGERIGRILCCCIAAAVVGRGKGREEMMTCKAMQVGGYE